MYELKTTACFVQVKVTATAARENNLNIANVKVDKFTIYMGNMGNVAIVCILINFRRNTY